MFISVVIPTYNRRPILEKCLLALREQSWDASLPLSDYEVIVVDDGSTDETIPWLASLQTQFPRLRVFEQPHQGPAAARNVGVLEAQGDTIIFIDSDLVVTSTFLASHAQALAQGIQDHGPKVFTYGRVINTANFDNPAAESYKLTDFSAAYFATGNVAIAKQWLLKAGLFDTQFSLYGWEDLELGVRLHNLGLKLLKCPAAVGYHWHPPFQLAQLPSLIAKERERGKMAVIFYRKHPTWRVRLMTQLTWGHRLLWRILTLNGLFNERTAAPFLTWLIKREQAGLALEVARIFLNWYCVESTYAALAQEPN
ncbi:MAG: glycosyltransferase [Cyanobacteria bacterium P01_H01_bin.15]